MGLGEYGLVESTSQRVAIELRIDHTGKGGPDVFEPKAGFLTWKNGESAMEIRSSDKPLYKPHIKKKKVDASCAD